MIQRVGKISILVHFTSQIRFQNLLIHVNPFSFQISPGFICLRNLWTAINTFLVILVGMFCYGCRQLLAFMGGLKLCRAGLLKVAFLCQIHNLVQGIAFQTWKTQGTMIYIGTLIKVQLFWEGHKNLKLSPAWFDIY